MLRRSRLSFTGHAQSASERLSRRPASWSRETLDAVLGADKASMLSRRVGVGEVLVVEECSGEKGRKKPFFRGRGSARAASRPSRPAWLAAGCSSVLQVRPRRASPDQREPQTKAKAARPPSSSRWVPAGLTAKEKREVCCEGGKCSKKA